MILSVELLILHNHTGKSFYGQYFTWNNVATILAETISSCEKSIEGMVSALCLYTVDEK